MFFTLSVSMHSDGSMDYNFYDSDGAYSFGQSLSNHTFDIDFELPDSFLDVLKIKDGVLYNVSDHDIFLPFTSSELDSFYRGSGDFDAPSNIYTMCIPSALSPLSKAADGLYSIGVYPSEISDTPVDYFSISSCGHMTISSVENTVWSSDAKIGAGWSLSTVFLCLTMFGVLFSAFIRRIK